MKKIHGFNRDENFVTFRGHHNMKYKTYEDTTPCIASPRWGKGLQANWPPFYVRFAYPTPPKSEKIVKKGPKKLTFHPRRKPGRRYRASLGGGKYTH
jgi:hypothetical protein